MSSTQSVPARRWSAAAVLAASILLAGCSSILPGSGATAPATPAPAAASVGASVGAAKPTSSAAASSAPSTSGIAGVEGTWNGRYTSATGDGGTFSMTFTQSGAAVQGSIKLSSTCVPAGSINGTLTDAKLQFGTIPGPSGGQPVTFDGSVTGNEMKGSYKAPGCGNDSGTWQATR